jgi:very-short-patch-repair endonuclease
MAPIDDRIHQLARLGLVTRPGLLAVGLSRDDIAGRLVRGSLRSVHPGVYATFGTPLEYRSRLLAACLAAGDGAVASHRSALWIWDLLDGEQPVEVTAPRQSHPVPDAFVLHRPNQLRPMDVTTRRQVPVTNPMRSLLDAGAVLPPRLVGECVERALESRLVSVRGLRVILAELGGRGRAGTGPLRGYLDRRALGDRRPESMIEPLMARLLYADLGIGPIEYQATLVLEGQQVRPDFLASRAMAVVEVDGLDAHGSRAALDHDLQRQNLLVRHGYLVLRYTTTHLRRPATVAKEIIDACRRRIVELERLEAS